MTNPTREGHVVALADRERIRCQDASGCQRPAVWSQHSPFDVGWTAGISFYYYCEEHAIEAGARERNGGYGCPSAAAPA